MTTAEMFGKLYDTTKKYYPAISDNLRDDGGIGDITDDIMRRLLGQQSYYQEQMDKENDEYWSDYIKNTGVEPKYPIRVGMNQNQPTAFMPSVTGEGVNVMKKLYGGMD